MSPDRMDPTIVTGVILVLIAVLVAWLFLGPRLRRGWHDRRAFPAAWLQILRSRLPMYDAMPPELQREWQQLIHRFVDGHEFIGCAGLEVTEEMRIVIAAQACLLLLNRPTHEYQDLGWIYVYPTAFRATHTVRDEVGVETTGERDLLGESWSNGKVILAWDDVDAGVRNFTDGHNVVLHEFAHQLDHESGATNGAPLLYTRAAYRTWALVFGREFERLRHPHPFSDVIDEYGATNPAEFFAVATETFFEEPRRMRRHHAALYELLKDYYRLDPETWQPVVSAHPLTYARKKEEPRNV